MDADMGANRNCLGKEIDDDMIHEIERLKADRSINLVGEFDEYHMLVVDYPSI
jgi:diphthamide synthase (EF-2-diphthine--ammonia ligase)